MQKSALQLKYYFFPAVSIQANGTHVTDAPPDPTLPKVKIQSWLDESNDLNMLLETSFGSKKPSDPYEGSVDVFGVFELPLASWGAVAVDRKREAFVAATRNAAQILYGSCREYVAAITGRGPYLAHFLPAVILEPAEMMIQLPEELKESAPRAASKVKQERSPKVKQDATPKSAAIKKP